MMQKAVMAWLLQPETLTMSSLRTAWEAVPRMILRPTLYSAYVLDFCKKQKLMVYLKKPRLS